MDSVDSFISNFGPVIEFNGLDGEPSLPSCDFEISVWLRVTFGIFGPVYWAGGTEKVD